jgi:ribosomal protein L21
MFEKRLKSANERMKASIRNGIEIKRVLLIFGDETRKSQRKRVEGATETAVVVVSYQCAKSG